MIKREQIKKGDKIRDNSPKRPGRTLTVYEVAHVSVYAENSINYRRTTISLEDIFADGKPRRSGFTLIAEAAA